MFIFPMATFSSGVYPSVRRGLWRQFCLSTQLFSSLICTEESLAGFNNIYGKPAVKVVKFGLVWDAMARSLGTPDERMCEYFGPFCLFYIDILYLFRF